MCTFKHSTRRIDSNIISDVKPNYSLTANDSVNQQCLPDRINVKFLPTITHKAHNNDRGRDEEETFQFAINSITGRIKRLQLQPTVCTNEVAVPAVERSHDNKYDTCKKVKTNIQKVTGHNPTQVSDIGQVKSIKKKLSTISDLTSVLQSVIETKTVVEENTKNDNILYNNMLKRKISDISTTSCIEEHPPNHSVNNNEIATSTQNVDITELSTTTMWDEPFDVNCYEENNFQFLIKTKAGIIKRLLAMKSSHVQNCAFAAFNSSIIMDESSIFHTVVEATTNDKDDDNDKQHQQYSQLSTINSTNADTHQLAIK